LCRFFSPSSSRAQWTRRTESFIYRYLYQTKLNKTSMCGIVAYIGPKQAYPILVKGLQRLEYRGYDSAGVVMLEEGFNLYKKAGKVNDLLQFTAGKNTEGTIGIGHTRWATHGLPND